MDAGSTRLPRLALALALATALATGGCGSVLSRMLSSGPQGEDRGYFQGVKSDAWLFARGSFDRALILLFPLLLIDFPLSLLVDVVCLPYDIYAHQPDRTSEVPTPPPAPKRTPPPPKPAPPPPRPVERLTAEELSPEARRLWDTVRGGPRKDHPIDCGPPGPEVAALASASGELRLVGIGGRRARVLAGAPVCVVAAIGSGDAFVGHQWAVFEPAPRALDASAEAPPIVMSMGSSPVTCLARARTGRAIVGAEHGVVLREPTVHAPFDPQMLRRLQGPAWPLSAAITADGERAAAGTAAGEVVVWDLGPARYGYAFREEPPRRVLRSGGRPWATCLEFDGDAVLWVGHSDGSVVRWRLPPATPPGVDPAGAPAAELRGQDAGAVLALAVGADGTAVTAGESDRITFHAPDGSTASLRFEGLGAPAAHVVALDLSEDGRELLVGSLDGVVRHVERATGRLLHRIDLTAIEDRPRAVALEAHGVMVVTERGTLLRFAPE